MRLLLKGLLLTGVILGFPLTDSALIYAQGTAQLKDMRDNYELGPDSQVQPGVPQGKLFSFEYTHSQIYPGTTRTITVYVPDQYTGEKPACVYVGLDGLGFGAHLVFDNLIHKGDMPVTIGIGISPGVIPSLKEGENPHFNRSFEFDGMNDSLARCVLEEIFPEVEKRQTLKGLEIKLSKDPNDRCTGGGSTGGIAAFTLAWERPDQFRRVFSAIGTYVGMRGGDRYPVLVRKTEPKPIRVFQQDGENDQWMGGPEVGDWWMGNLTLDRALEFSGYEHQHAFGTGTHSGKHAAAIFPDAMRYLWKDWPQPIQAQTARTQNVMLKSVLNPTANWQQVTAAGDSCRQLAVDPQGEIYFQDSARKITRRLRLDGTLENAPEISSETGFAFSLEGQAVTLQGLKSPFLTINDSGLIYATDPEAGKVWLTRPDGTRTLLDQGLKTPTGIALSPDGLWLMVMESGTHWGYNYRVLKNGVVDLKQRFYWAHVPDNADDSGAGSVCMDTDGHPYVATRMGVQIFDRNGRSRGILPVPGGAATSVTFGGEKFGTLYVISNGKLYQRKMTAIGAPAFLPAEKLPNWGPG